MRHILKLHRDLTSDLLPQSTHNFTIETFNTGIHKQQWLDLNNQVFLATENAVIKGFVWTKIHQDLVNQDPVGELYVVGTAPAHHGRGIARALSVEAINYFVTKGLKHAMLYVDADNEKGLKLYQSLGFN